MKAFILFASFLAFVPPGGAFGKDAVGRSISDVDIIPTGVLQRAISPKFYKTLLVSPIKGYVVVRGSLSGTRMNGMRIVHSEPNNLNDHLALQRASEVTIAGNYSIEHPNVPSSVLVHLLLYQTADGTLALSFAHFDGAGGNQMQYWGCTRMAVLKNDGQWVDIKGPSGLEGKGLTVRQGIKNDLKTAMKLDAFSFSAGAESTNMGR